eukprot:gene6110-6185_t
MFRQIGTPAIDRSLAPRSAVARDGQPLSFSRAPSPDLVPWVARLYVSSVAAPASHELSCGLFSEAAVLRIQLDGDWLAHTADGPVASDRNVFLFGPHSRRMPVRVRGGFTSVGVTFCPGAVRVLGGWPANESIDRLTDPVQIGIDPAAWLDLFATDIGPEGWCLRLEQALRRLIARRALVAPDPVSAAFERASYADPSIAISEYAVSQGIELRRLERVIRRDFGISPKQVLRRARMLDMASHLRGVADKAEAEALMLRYYDQSHLIRDFTQLIGMSPRQFVERPQPLMTLSLETRQARRLEVLDRLTPGQSPPWLGRVLGPEPGLEPEPEA